MMKARTIVAWFGCLSLIILWPVVAQAQLQSGAVRGKVIAPDGSPAVGAKIIIESLESEREYVMETDDKGEFFRMGMRPGRYSITVEWRDLKGTREVQVAGGLYGNPNALQFRNQFDIDLGDIVEQAKEVQKEDEEFEKAKVGFDRAVAYNKAGKYQEAVEELKPVIEHDPSQWVAHAQLAIAYTGLGRTEEAVNAYLTAIELNPTDPSLYNNLGQLYMEIGRVEEAREQFEMAAELSADESPTFYYNTAVTFYNSGDLQAAIQPLKKVVELKPDHANAHFFLGICLYSTAESKVIGGEVKTVLPPGTREHFQRYLELQPSGPHAEQAKQYLEIIDTTSTVVSKK